MRIQHNISALNTYRQMSTNNTGSSKALEKLSSGYKINRAGDDAAGLAISEKMRAQITGLGRASANAQDGVSLIQAAEGALQETHSILQRMRELGVQAANDVNEAEDRKAIQDEINQLTKEVDRIAFTTEFNKKTLLDGSLDNGKYIRSVSGSNVSSVALIPPTEVEDTPIVKGLTTVSVINEGERFNQTFDFALDPEADTTTALNGQVEAEGSGTISITLSADVLKAAGLAEDTEPYQVAVNIGDTASVIAGNVRDILSQALGADWSVTTNGSKMTIENKYVGFFEEAFTIESEAAAVNAEVGTAEGTAGKDVYITINGEAVDFTEFNTHLTAWESGPDEGGLRGKDSIAQIRLGVGEGETAAEQFSFKIDDATKLSTAIIGVAEGKELTLQVGANTGYDQTIAINVKSLSAKSLGIAELDVSGHKESQNAVASLENAIQTVSDQRAGLGAVQNRLEHTVANLDTVAENLQSAESRVRDVDMAKEMMNFTKFNILMQASQAMMAQANSQPQGVLQLLR